MSLSRWLLGALAMASLLAAPSLATNWSARELYSGSHCAGTPNILTMIQTDSCDADACTAHDLGGYTLFVSVACNVTDRFKYTQEIFRGFDYVMMEEYEGAGCQHLVQTAVYPASGTCEKSSVLANSSDVVSLFDNGTAIVLLFDDGECGSKPTHEFKLGKQEISNGDCVQGRYRFYTGTASRSADSSSSSYSYENSQLGGWRSSSSGGLSTEAIAGIVAGAAVCVAFLAFATFKFIRRRYDDNLTKDTGIAVLAASYAGYPTPESALNAITLGSESSYSQEEEKPRSRRNLSGHTIPYANAKENSDSGRAMPDLAILQMVATGRLRIEFSSAAPKAIKELGMACVSIDPKDRPTASDALYQLHTILSRGP
ncbi:hypothetical protein PRNP1_014594 [Phytophthora ramorum]